MPVCGPLAVDKRTGTTAMGLTMHGRIGTGALVTGVFLAMLTPVVLLPGNAARIDRFLDVRSRVLSALNQAPTPPKGFSRRIEVSGPDWDPAFPGNAEIRRISRTRGWWRQTSQQITYVRADGWTRSGNPDSLAESLLRLEAAGLARAGLRPLTSGSTRRSADAPSAAAVQVWGDPDHFLTVIVQAAVPGGAREAQVSRHVIEQVSRRP